MELTCPVCSADLGLAGDEKPGDEIYCTYCGAPCVIRAEDSQRAEGWSVEEDL